MIIPRLSLSLLAATDVTLALPRVEGAKKSIDRSSDFFAPQLVGDVQCCTLAVWCRHIGPYMTFSAIASKAKEGQLGSTRDAKMDASRVM